MRKYPTGKGRGVSSHHLCFLWKKAFFPLSSHLFLTEVTAITICQPVGRFCHQLAAKSASPPNKNEAISVSYKSLFSTRFFSFHSRYHSFKGENRCLQCSSLVLSDLQAPGSGAGGPCGWGIKSLSPLIGKFVLWISNPCSRKFTRRWRSL